MPSFANLVERPSHSSYRAREHDLHTKSDKKPLVLPGQSEDKGNTHPTGVFPPSPADSISFETALPLPTKKSLKIMTSEAQLNDLVRGAPGDQAIFSDSKTPEQRELAKRKSAYYGEAFAHREPATSPRERVGKESIIMAEVRTNVIVHDEYTFITDLSYSLSTRYQRPESSILVTLNHSACLLLGGSFEPAYYMTISALPSQIQPVTNKRNAALLQRGMEEALGVAPNRGIIKFVGIPEANLATNGKTALGEIESMEKEGSDENGMLRKASRAGSKSHGKQTNARSPKSAGKDGFKDSKPLIDKQTSKNARLTPDSSDQDVTSPLPSSFPSYKSSADLRAEKVQKVGRRKSFMAMFGR